MNAEPPIQVEVTASDGVPDAAKEAARSKVGHVAGIVKGPVLAARVVLIAERNPRIEEPARAEGEINLAGRPVRAHAAARTMEAAVDLLADRLHRRLRDAVERMITRQRTPDTSAPGEWRHGTRPAQ